MGRLKKGEMALVEIDSLNKKGNGVGVVRESDSSSVRIEVPFALPGERVVAKVMGRNRGGYSASIESVEHPSAGRIEPRCSHFGQCGGCRFQNSAYEQQLKFKEDFVKRCFAGPIAEGAEFRPVIPCVPGWEYRNKMEFTFSSDLSGNRYLGLIKESGRGRVIDIDECFLAAPWFTDVLRGVRSWWAESGLNSYRTGSDSGSLRTLVVREGKRTGDRMVILTVSGKPDFALNKGQLEGFVKAVCSSSEQSDPDVKLSIYLRIQQVAKGMSTNFYEMLLYGPEYIREVLEVQVMPGAEPQKFYFHVSPTAFFQPNTLQAEKLYSTALQMVGVVEGGVVYDLYCGTGTLGILAASFAREVIGIEVSSESALDAKTNASLNNIKNLKIICGAVRHVLAGLTGEPLPRPDLVIVDPPRPGLDPVAMKGLLALQGPRILYISCNPETQAENVQELMGYGYNIEMIQPVDQFAHTPHIENIVLLKNIVLLEKRS